MNGNPWTADEDERLRELWVTAPLSKVMRAIPRHSFSSISCRASDICAGRRKKMRSPSRATYLRFATEEAAKARVSVSDVLDASHYRAPAYARWRVFKRLRDLNCSFLGIAKVSGFDHTAVLAGVRRLAEIEAKR